MLSSLLLLAFLCLSSQASKVYLVNNHDSDDATMTLFSVDTATKDVTAIANYSTGVGQFTPITYGGTVCADVYWGYFADITTQSFGLVQVDLKSSKPEAKYFDTPVLYHSLACDPLNKKGLLAVGSVSGSPAQFSLRRAQQVDQTSFNDTVVADLKLNGFFGYDSSFSFTQDGSQLYAGGGQIEETRWHRWNHAKPGDRSKRPGATSSSGNIIAIETASGKQVGDWTLPRGDLPYAVFPDTKPLQGMVLTGGFNRPAHYWAEIDLSGSSAKVRKGALADKYYNQNAMPVCGDSMFTTGFPDSSDQFTFYEVDAQTGATKGTIDLAPHMITSAGHSLAGLACSQ